MSSYKFVNPELYYIINGENPELERAANAELDAMEDLLVAAAWANYYLNQEIN